MRILFVSDRAPSLPCPDAFRAATAELVLALRKRNTVGVLAAAAPDDSASQRGWATRHAEVAEVLPPARWRQPLTGAPDAGLAAIGRALTATVRRFRPDVIHFGGPVLAPLATATGAPTVLTVPAADTPLGRRAWRAPLARLASWVTHRQDAAWQRRWLPAVSACIVATDRDRDRLARLVPGVRLDVVAPGIDVERYAFRRVGHALRMVFAGNVGVADNAALAAHVARTVLPRIRESHPLAELLVVGTRWTPACRALARLPGVRVLAAVSDVRPALWSAGLALALSPHDLPGAARGNGPVADLLPLAMALGTPVVASPATAAAHPGLVPGQHVVVAAGVAGLADAARRLASRPDVANQIARNARACVEQRATWRAVAARYEQVFARVAASAVPRGERATA